MIREDRELLAEPTRLNTMGIPRRVSVKGMQGVDTTVVVTVVQGKVWMSISPPFSWEAIMEPGKVDELVEELVATLQAAVSIDNLWPVSQLLIEWRHTAEIYADPLLYIAATPVLGDDCDPVPRPESPESVVSPKRGVSGRATAQRGTVWLTYAGTGHPKATD